MFDEHLGLFGAELPAASGTVETNLAVEMYFLTATFWAVHILALRLNHLAALSLTIGQLLIDSRYFIGIRLGPH